MTSGVITPPRAPNLPVQEVVEMALPAPSARLQPFENLARIHGPPPASEEDAGSGRLMRIFYPESALLNLAGSPQPP